MAMSPGLASISNPGMKPGQDPGAPPPRAPDSQPSDNQPAVEPGQPTGATLPGAASPTQQPSKPPPPPEPIVTWDEVTAKPGYQGLEPEQKEQVRDAYWKEVIAPKLPPEQQKLARQAFDNDTLPKKGPQASGGTVGKVLDYALGSQLGLAEETLHLGSQIVGGMAGGVASLYEGITAPAGLKAKEAAGAAEAVSNAVTYQPHFTAGKKIAGMADAIAGVVPKVADWATKDIAEDPTLKRVLGPTGSEVVQGLANTAAVAIPTLLGAKGAKAIATESGAAATAARATVAATRASEGLKRAQAYIKAKTSLDWDTIPANVQKNLTDVATHDPDALVRLKPKAIERQARLEELDIPASRGAIERDRAQMTHEQTLSKGDVGKPLQAIRDIQDTALHHHVDIVRRSTGAKASTRQGVGESVERALRGTKEESPEKWGTPEIEKGLKSSAKAVWSKANYNRSFATARATEPSASVSPEPIVKLLDKNPDMHELGWLSSWLKRAKVEQTSEKLPEQSGTRYVDAEGGPRWSWKTPVNGPQPGLRSVKLDELTHLREQASAIARTGQGSEKLYAGKVVGAIDEAMGKIPAAAKNWRKAFGEFKQHNIEFGDQALVNQLTDMKSRTDPVTALEDTSDVIRGHSAADIRNLKKTLTEGGTAATRAAGQQAWKDIQGSLLDYLKERADPAEEKGGAEQAQFSKGFRKEFRELDKDGKIDAIFSPAQAKRLRAVAQATEDVRTQPRMGVTGSDTAANLQAAKDRQQLKTLSVLEKTSRFGKTGQMVAGGARWLRSLKESGQAIKDVATAKRSRLDEAAEDARKKAPKPPTKLGNTLRSIRAGAGVAHRATLKDKKKDDKKK